MTVNRFRLRPSAADVWMFCGGSVEMQACYPGEDGPDARNGTAVHWVMECLMTGIPSAPGAVAPNGVVIDKDMVDAAHMAFNVAASWGIPVYVEKTMPANRIHHECGGTPDIWAYDSAKRTIYLLDLKYGFGIVEPFENWQLLCYIAAIIEALNLSSVEMMSHRVEFIIVQPRATHREGPVREWIFCADALHEYFDKMIARAHVAASADASTVAGEHCEHCTARHACETNQRGAYRAADIAGSAVPFDLSAGAAARELRYLEDAAAVLKARISGLAVQVTSDLERGVINDHFTLERKHTRTAWKPGMESHMIAVGEMLGVDLKQPAKAVTPTQAAKIVDKDLVKQFSYKPAGDLALVKIDTSDIRRIFGAI